MIGRLLAGLINFFVAIATLFLGLRVLLRLFGANSDNGFVRFVYDSSGILLEPFRGIFPTADVQSLGVIDFSALFAMLVYGLIGMAFLSLVTWLTPSEEEEVVRKK